MRKLLLGLGATLICNSLMAQLYSGSDAQKFYPSAAVVRMDERSTAPLFVEFAAGQSPSAAAADEILKSVLKGTSEDSWRSIRTDYDEIGMQHHRYQQLFRGIPVVTGEYILHEQQGLIRSMNGVFFKDLRISTNPVVTESAALQLAMNDIGANIYLWQASQREQEALTGHFHAGQLPAGELVILPSLGYDKNQTTALCWKFDVYAIDPHQRYNVYVNAIDGRVMFKENRICTFVANGSGNTKYSGLQSFTTDSIAPGSYRLRDISRGGGVETYDMNNGTNYGSAVDFTDTDNFWNTTTNQDDAANDVHWGTQKTYDYYLQTHNRNSYNNAGAVLKSYVHYSSGYNNAFWNGSQMTYGDGDGSTFTPLTELDIVAHELTHGVTNFTSNLLYSNQSGALNESFSDIFGVTVDFFARPGAANWLLGDACYTPGTPGDAIRSMSNPNSQTDPDTYLGTYWYTGTADAGGVHTNSGVQNFWYYLLCNGGTGTNDVGFNYNVTSITMAKARLIAYRNNTFYLTSGSVYSDAGFYSLQAATDLYGPCSPEAVQVKNAWDAVNVTGLQLNISATATANSVCLGGTIQLNATGGTTYSWTGPGGFTSSIANPSISNASLTTNGTYACTITAANGCSSTKSVTVSANPNPSVSISGATPICPGGSVNLLANATVPGSGSSTGFNTTDIAIPDANQTGIVSPITLGQSTSASAIINVKIDSLIHPYVADLTIQLIAPNGSTITLASGVGGAGDNFINTVFTSSATTAISAGVAPFTGSYLPQMAFSNLTGSANGTWNLKVIDGFGQDLGTLMKWSITATPNTIISYNWSPSTGLSSTTTAATVATPASSTTYTVIATDAFGCTASANAPLNVSVIEATANVFNPLCNGTTGSIDITVAGGNAPYTYLWSDGSTNQDLNNALAGIYSVVITDAAGCTTSLSRVLTNPPSLNVGIGSSDATCGNNDGSISLSVSGGSLPYSYLWNNSATTPDLLNIGAGYYSCVITDANGCTAFGDATVGSTGSAPNPPAAVSGPGGACRLQNAVTYSVPAIPGATAYNWTLPSGATGTSTTNSISVNFGSTYAGGNICVSVTNNCGTSSATCFAVSYISATPSMPASITGAIQACAGSTASFTAATSTNATNYNWTAPANATIISGQGTQTVTISFASNFVYGDIAVSATNCVGASAPRKLRVYNKPGTPGLVTGGAYEVCANTSGTYSITPVVAATSYNWVAPAGATILSGQGTTSVVVNFGSTFTSGALTVAAVNTCGSSANRTKAIYSKPSTPGVITGQSGQICPGLTLNYSVSAVMGATTYNWSVPNNAVITNGQGTNAITVQFNTGFSGGSITVNASNLCGTSALRSLVVSGAPAMPGGMTGPASNNCGATGVAYSVPVVANTQTYNWTVPSFATIVSGQGTNSIVVDYANVSGSSGTVCVAASNACGAGLPRCLTAVTTLPLRPTAINGSATVCAGQQNVAYSAATQPGVTYTWTVPTGATIVSGQGTGNIVVNWGTTAGAVGVYGTNGCGNSLTRVKYITFNCREAASGLFEVNLYPNPARSVTNIGINGKDGIYTVELTDITGKVVMHQSTTEHTLELSLSGLEAGIYLVKVTDSEGAVEINRLAIE